jgi:hypothetical protein
MSTVQLLESMHAIAIDTMWLAMLWHVALLVALVAFLRGWRPNSRLAARLLALPVVSVAIVAAVAGNPFNTIVFAALAIVFVAYAQRMPATTIVRPADWQVTAGHAFIGFGVFYPHFLEGQSPLAYIVAAPFGALPCPTLTVLAGFTLIAGGFSRAWNHTLVFFSVFYGAVGVAKLDIWIDIVLVLSGLALAWMTASQMTVPRSRTYVAR